jgi:hypothetical protein
MIQEITVNDWAFWTVWTVGIVGAFSYKLMHWMCLETTSRALVIRGATALTNLGRLSIRRWQSFPTAPDGTGLTCGQHIESHRCIFSFPNRTVTFLFK